MKGRINRNFKTLLKKENDYCKPVRVGNFWSSNFIDYERNGGRNKNLAIKEYLRKMKAYLKGAIHDPKNLAHEKPNSG